MADQLTAVDIKTPEEWGSYFDSLRTDRMKNRILRMQYDDLIKDREVSNILSHMPQYQQPPSWEEAYGGRFDPNTGSILPGAVAGRASGAVPVTAQQWDEMQRPQPIPLENRLATIAITNPELAPQATERLAAERKRKMDVAKANMEIISKVHSMNPEAANEMFNNNPDLVAMAGGPVSISGDDQKEYRGKDGQLMAISYRLPNGTWSTPQKPVEPTTDLSTYKAANPKKEGETVDQWNKRIWEGYHKAKTEEGKQKIEFTADLREKGKEKEEERRLARGFKGWSQDEKENQFWTTILTGKDPKFSWGDRDSYTRFNREKNRFEIDHAITPAMKARIQTDYKSLDRSVANQRKIYDMMVGFAGNLNQQIDKVKDIYKKLPRTQYRLLNIPIVELRTRAMGKGEEAAAASYLIEISNEIGKLSTGSAASIRELSESAQERWNKIHDGKLSFKDIEKVLDTTKEQAKMRIDTSKMAMDYTRQAIEDLPRTAGGSTSSSSTNIIPRTQGETIDQYLKRIGGK